MTARVRERDAAPVPASVLQRRLRSLWTGELFNVVFQPAVLLFLSHTLGLPVGPLGWYALALVALILTQGAAYWWLKLRALRRGQAIPASSLAPFRLFKFLNWALLALLPVWLGLRARGGESPFVSVLDAHAMLWYGLLALGEQVNYYYHQLMYDNAADLAWLWRHRRAKVPALRRDLERTSL